MRIDVEKYLFAGLQGDKKSFFEAAQKLGIVHFISMKGTARPEVPLDIHNTMKAIKVLNGLPVVEQEELEDEAGADDLVDKILHLKISLEKVVEEQRILNLEIRRVAPYGSYSKEDLDWIEHEGSRKVQFFCAKQGFAASGHIPENVIFITTENDLDYFVAINPEVVQYEQMIEIQPQGALNVLEHNSRLLIKEVHDGEARLKNYAKYNDYLHQVLLAKLNRAHLLTAETSAYLVADDKLFAVEGWVPADKVEALQSIAKELHVYISEIAIEPADAVPTYLENQGFARIGEDLVNIYDTPSTSDSDPSLWVLFFFALFFSMIIGDGGYGLVLLLAGLFFKFKSSNLSLQGRRFVSLTLILASFCMVWGLLTTSFFGIAFSPDSPIRKASVLTWLAEKKAEYHFSHNDEVARFWTDAFPALDGMQNPKELLMTAMTVDPKTHSASYEMLDVFSNEILLELALFIGVLHLSLSFMRNLRRNLAGIGWLLFLLGAYLYFPAFLDATSLIHFGFGVDKLKGAENGFLLMFGGIGIAVIIAVIRDKIFGLLECMNILQIFGDVMSYLRLYALGLSGALVVSTANEFAGGLNFVLAALLLIIAHSINLVLCIMGGVIHGLRLNFLEWYHYCFDGGGKQFNPLKKHT